MWRAVPPAPGQPPEMAPEALPGAGASARPAARGGPTIDAPIPQYPRSLGASCIVGPPLAAGLRRASHFARARPTAVRRPVASQASRVAGQSPSAGQPRRRPAAVRRPPARGGPTIYDAVVPLVERSYIVGPPLAGGLAQSHARCPAPRHHYATCQRSTMAFLLAVAMRVLSGDQATPKTMLTTWKET